MVSSDTETSNSSCSRMIRSQARHRTTPWTAGIGPSSTMRARKARCVASSLGGTPGEGMLKRPSGPCLLNRITQSLSDVVAVTGDVYYSPSWLNSGAYGLFASGILKLTAPSAWFPKDWGGYFQGEVGYYWFGTTDTFYAIPANCCGFPNFPAGIKYPDYATWNLGVGITYKVFTLDLRYWDTNLSKANCNVLTGDHTASINPGAVTPTNPSGLQSNWCGSTFVAKFSADLTLNTNVK